MIQLEGGQTNPALLGAAMSGVPAEIAADVRGVSAADVAQAAQATLQATPAYAVVRVYG